MSISGDIDRMINSLCKEPLDNLKLICDYLAEKAGAECCISSCDETGDFCAIASCGERLKYETPDSMKQAQAGRELIWINTGTVELCFPLICRPIALSNLTRRATVGTITELHGFICFKWYEGPGLPNEDLIKLCESLAGLIINNLEFFSARLNASTDKLTGILNRKYLDSMIASLFEDAIKNNTELSIIMADLDFFKNVNDTYGHQKGDEVLRRFSEILRDNCSDKGIVGRYGGEEFVIVMMNTGSEEAFATAEQLRILTKNADILEGKRDVTVSMGVASYPKDAVGIKNVMTKADKALFIAKKSGRNKCIIWNESYNDMEVEMTQDFFSGDIAKDSTKMTVLFEIMDDLNIIGDIDKKLEPVLKKLLDVIKGASATVFVLDKDSNITDSFQQLQRGFSTWDTQYNEKIIAEAIEKKNVITVVDWDSDALSSSGGVSDWYSVVAAPAICGEFLKGVLYINVPIKIKEFSYDEISFAENVASLISTVL